MGTILDMTKVTQRKFGRLTIVGDFYRRKSNSNSKIERWYVKVECDCGVKKEAAYADLKDGSATSCGCYLLERLTEVKTTHGQRHHPLYQVWNNMKRRCYDKSNKSYCRYGGRGITVCDEWLSDFKPFYDWAISNGYQKGLTVDRKNNNGNYHPLNCRFATPKMQARNTRQTKLTEQRAKHIRILYKGGRMSMKKIGELYGIGNTTVSHVIYNRNWI